jgi:ABC-2 type transport system permease protein
MSQVWAIILAKLRISAHQVASVRHESKLKVSVITVSALALWAGAYFLFAAGFQWVVNFDRSLGTEFAFADILMYRLLGLFALSVFLLLIFSNALVAFSTFYKAHEVYYLLHAPLSYRQFFYARFFECVAFSSWALAFLGSPLLLAYGVKSQASPLFYLAAALFYIPYILAPAAIGCFVTLVLTRVFPRLRLRTMVALGALAVLGLFYYLRGILVTTEIRDDTMAASVFLDYTARLQSPLLPSYWAAQGMTAMARARMGEGGYYFLLLLSNALMLPWVCGEAAHRIFFPGWSSLHGMDRQRIKREGRGILGRLDRALRAVRNPYRALVVKDIKLFWRDPTQWAQFVIFFGIMALYFANLRNTSRYYEEPFWRSWIACLNVGAVLLILATLTSRFIFPLVSLEGRRFWILGLAPLTYRQLVWQKFWLSVCTVSPFTVGLAALSGYMLKLEPVYYALSVYSVVLTNLGLSGLAVGLGTLYPSFHEDNPARIVSGMGGTLNLLVSVAYIVLVVGAQTVILQWRVLEAFASPQALGYALAGAVLFITVVSAIAMLAPMRLGLRNLEKMEF